MITTEFITEKVLHNHLFAYVTFGRDIAQFEQLVQFLTWLSLIIWGSVILTTALRTTAHYTHMWHRYRHRKSLAASNIAAIQKPDIEKKRHGYS